ncbi:hypothetical protein GS399_15445 [Pedobacter sp. HMF7647]|uniref:Ig-like domain-containing protein n=1 Tax=Hufsiella arboris TaxID=2695275 RepID=A0A7K1YEA5_9SPHI|nr:hypothetical protein [Hufsiella arboris]MXV52368.1 hypothetical protein [Hufsiella arboris]
MDFHISKIFLQNKNILKAKRDFGDPYLWVLAKNNEVYRINSITNVLEDYTARFSAYGNLNFIDIAGHNKDSVYIATSSTNVILYLNGLTKVIGSQEGIPGTVNSIGMDYPGGYVYDFIDGDLRGREGDAFFIATDHGMCLYDYKLGKILPNATKKPAKVFEATYRSEMFSNLDFGGFFSLIPQYSTIQLNKGTSGGYGGTLYYGADDYGNNIYTAYYTYGMVGNDPADLSVYESGFLMNIYWGSENGLFQKDRNYSSNYTSPHKHYLHGLKVNKITSIYGLRAFGSGGFFNPGLIKENLLVGTDKGFYFSTSGYEELDENRMNKYSFFKHPGFGDKVINDICVNATSYQRPVCEDGVWVSTESGLYLLKPDYAPYIDFKKRLKAIYFGGEYSGDTVIQVCQGVNTVAINPLFSSVGSLAQWYRNGIELSGESDGNLKINSSGEYYAILYDPCSGFHIETNHLKVSVLQSPVFSFEYPDTLKYCKGSLATLKTENNPAYRYRWYRDNVLINQTNARLDISESGRYRIEVSACKGSWVSSKSVRINFVELPEPVISSAKPSYCEGETAQLSINVNADSANNIDWLRDGKVVKDLHGKITISTTEPGLYSVELKDSVSGCKRLSEGFSLSFIPFPELTISKQNISDLCAGQPVVLTATHSPGTFSWSTGETKDSIRVYSSGMYYATIKPTSGCSVTLGMGIKFFANPVLNLSDTSVCSFSGEKITLSAPPGFKKYEWNGREGTDKFTTAEPGPVILL